MHSSTTKVKNISHIIIGDSQFYLGGVYMYKLLTNFKKQEKEEIIQCLRIADITDYNIEEAYDYFNKILKDCYGLYIPEEDFEEKKYNIELYHKARHCFKDTIYDEYKKRGYNILPSNKHKLYFSMDEEYVESLCKR